MRTFFLMLFAVALPDATLAQERLNRVQTERAVYALNEWLESEHGDPDELTPLTRFGPVMVPSLIAALETGPSPARRERLRRVLDAEHASLAGPKVPTKDDYVRQYTSNFEVRYRIRAAQALAAIGGPEARKAIGGAAAKASREDLRAVLQQILKELK